MKRVPINLIAIVGVWACVQYSALELADWQLWTAFTLRDIGKVAVYQEDATRV